MPHTTSSHPGSHQVHTAHLRFHLHVGQHPACSHGFPQSRAWLECSALILMHSRCTRTQTHLTPARIYLLTSQTRKYQHAPPNKRWIGGGRTAEAPFEGCVHAPHTSTRTPACVHACTRTHARTHAPTHTHITPPKVEREAEVQLECPDWLKTLIGHKSIRLRQRNTIDREKRTMDTEAWNVSLEGRRMSGCCAHPYACSRRRGEDLLCASVYWLRGKRACLHCLLIPLRAYSLCYKSVFGV